MIPVRPRYVIERVLHEGKRYWRIMVFRAGRSVGTILDHKVSKAGAITMARLLAGREGTVEVITGAP